MNTRISIFSAAFIAALLVTGCGKSKKEIPVTGIDIKPNSMELFIGQSLPVTVTTIPADATNTANLQVNVNKPDIAVYENGKVNALAAGSAKLIAVCDAVKSEANIKVYWTLTKNNVSYPIKKATGYRNYMGEPEVQYYDLDFTDGTEHIRIMIWAKHFGQKIDVSKPLPGLDEYDTCFINVVRNNNENDITIFLSGTEPPVIRNEMFDVLPVTPSGYFCVKQVTGKGYVVDVDVSLSNGGRWEMHYEGPIILQDENKP